MVKPWPGRLAFAIPTALVALLFAATSVVAVPAPAVRGGGVVAGDLGITSQLGFTATAQGGSFLCVMAGRSGGFPFADWDQILQMQVQGRVTPGTLVVDESWSQFAGIANIHVVGKADGTVVTATISDVAFVSTQAAGGAGEAWHILDLPELGLNFGGPDGARMKTGHISVWD